MWEGAFGQQDVDRNVVTRADTPFQLDGTTQAIVASLAIRCASDGWLSLDDPSVASSRPPVRTPAATLRQLLTHTTAGPNGLTFSYRLERLAPVAAAIAGCTDSSFRWGMSALFDQLAMTDSVPGSDVVRLKAPAESFTASALTAFQRRAAPARDALRGRRPRARDRVLVCGVDADAGVGHDFDGAQPRAVRSRAEEGRRDAARMANPRADAAQRCRTGSRCRTPTDGSCRTTTAARVVWQFGVSDNASSSMIIYAAAARA